MINPVKDMKITSEFGQRIHPVKATKSFHNGTDIACPVGTPILALDNGVVVASKVNNGGINCGLGYYIIVQYEGFCGVCAHLNTLGLPVGTVVKVGDVIGYSGNTGMSTGPHLHFEIRTGRHTSTFWQTNAEGKYPNATDPITFMQSKKPESIESIVARVKKRGIVGDPMYWIECLSGERAATADNLQSLFKNILKEI